MLHTLVPMRFEDQALLWVVDDVYSAAECESMVRQIEEWSPQIATNNPVYRDQDRVMRDDPVLASELFARLREHLPDTMGELQLLKLNDRLRFYRYRASQRFQPHMDHWYQPDELHITLLTVLVYFNDDFEGGQTRFMEQVEQTSSPRRLRRHLST